MNKEKQIKQKSIIKDLKGTKIFLFVYGAIFIAAIIILSTIYVTTYSDAVYYAFIGTLCGLCLVLIIYSIVIYVYYKKAFLSSFYNVTLSNLEKIAQQKRTLSFYDNKENLIEVNEANRLLNNINQVYSNSVLFSKNIKFNELPFEFVGDNIVTYSSFVREYVKLLTLVWAYKCAFISYKFPINENKLTIDEIKQFAEAVKKIFNYSDVLVADNAENNELLIFVTNFDSIDRLKEEIENSFEEIAFMIYTTEGYSIITPKVSLVIFPYSNALSIFSDLEYASRMGKTVNIYIPDSPNFENNDMLLYNNMSLNFGSYIQSKISSIKCKHSNLDTMAKEIDGVIRQICSYLSFDFATAYTLDSSDGSLVSFYDLQNKKVTFTRGFKRLTKDYVELLNQHIDPDCSYFFSSREHVNSEIGKMCDAYGTSSCYFFLIKNNLSEVVGMLIFGSDNVHKLDAYLRESLLNFSLNYQGLYFDVINKQTNEEEKQRNNNILKIANMNIYSVNSLNFELTYVSSTLNDLFPNLHAGQKCYHAIYGLNKPCKNCPLNTAKKMYSMIKNNRFETSLVLNNKSIIEKTMLMSEVENDEIVVRERFDTDLLINSFYSLLGHLKNYFAISQRGYMFIMNIDNRSEIQQKMPSETYNAFVRVLISEIRAAFPEIQELFFIPDRSLAIILPDSNFKDVISMGEKIYEITKRIENPNYKDCKLHLSYFIHSFPFGYQNSDEYLRYLLKVTNTPIDYLNKEYIFIPESKYSRKANRVEFLNDVLETSLTEKAFESKLQPIVDSNKRIYCAEMLLRVSDSYLGGELNTFEVINAAAVNNKISQITDIIIGQIGQIYKVYKDKLFNKYDIKHLSLNTDYSFFQDLNLIEKFNKVISDSDMPNDFIIFEISEKEIAEHYKEIGQTAQQLAKNNIKIYCDNYTSKFLQLNLLKNIGIAGIKIDRSIVSKLSENPEIINSISEIMNKAISLGLDVANVGIENRNEYLSINALGKECKYQGYYFYRPLSADELLNALISSYTK